MNKLLTLLFGLTLICGAVTACGDKNNSSSEANKNTEGTARVTETVVESRTAETDPDATENTMHDSRNGIEKIITGAGDAVGEAVSEGREIVTDVVDGMTSDKND